jgi:hypothetical protein
MIIATNWLQTYHRKEAVMARTVAQMVAEATAAVPSVKVEDVPRALVQLAQNKE